MCIRDRGVGVRTGFGQLGEAIVQVLGGLAHDEGRLVDDALGDDARVGVCLLYTSPSPRDRTRSRMPSSA